MGHTSADNLKDIAEVLREIRAWPGIKEKGIGIFYLKSIPFLHFHDKDGKRWADVKTKDGWGAPLNLPFDPGLSQKADFLKKAESRFKALSRK